MVELEKKVLAAVGGFADRMGDVAASYLDIANLVDCTPMEAHTVLLRLKEAGYFRGNPYFDSERFSVTLRGAVE